jgi:hypothetical protein
MPRMTLKERIEMSLRRSASAVFVRKEFDRFGGYDQVGRALREATRDGLLVKAGYGVYVKTRISSITGKPIPTLPIDEIARQALAKLGVEAGPSQAARAYAQGTTTQMPMAAALSVGKSRVARRIGYAGKAVRLERGR